MFGVEKTRWWECTPEAQNYRKEAGDPRTRRLDIFFIHSVLNMYVCVLVAKLFGKRLIRSLPLTEANQEAYGTFRQNLSPNRHPTQCKYVSHCAFSQHIHVARSFHSNPQSVTHHFHREILGKSFDQLSLSLSLSLSFSDEIDCRLRLTDMIGWLICGIMVHFTSSIHSSTVAKGGKLPKWLKSEAGLNFQRGHVQSTRKMFVRGCEKFLPALA